MCLSFYRVKFRGISGGTSVARALGCLGRLPMEAAYSIGRLRTSRHPVIMKLKQKSY